MSEPRPGGEGHTGRVSPQGGTRRRHRGRLRAAQWPMVLGLTLMWMLLWGTPTAANALTGALVGVVVCVVFPLPPIETQVRLRPAGILRFSLRFLLDMVVSSWRLNRYILGLRPPLCAVLAVRLRCPSDLMLTATSIAVSAVPGSNVLDVHRASGTLFVHVVGAGEKSERERARYEVLRLEARVVGAFGTRADVEALGAGGPGNFRKGGGPWRR
ncbi:multicomponent Na+:H+ antiporter subunit E [Streptomyces sp. WMMB 714]|jgi:multicomponent Na+:H+ antiporter subunit E|uniref:Na+/H+ antiporter subunit E n=1 Tax=Streptomyces sp. WMMB 714 TaxID=1286822 RepID=UPI000823985F|nr:Na+/H+ antiporter subunit E [Streptomyces sp. WMMB 714]SCK05971.1 multicomponent Na+:H+ antiporter subunit E [Streptomyces sp. WMMB 714]